MWRVATPYDFALRRMDCETFMETFYRKDNMFQIPIYLETSLDFALPKSWAKSGSYKTINELIEVDIIPKSNVGKHSVHKFWEEVSIEERWQD